MLTNLFFNKVNKQSLTRSNQNEVNPVACHEGTKVGVTLALKRIWSTSHPAALHPPLPPTGTHFIEGWVGLGADLDECGKYYPN